VSELAQAVLLAPEAVRTWLARSPFVAFLGLELMALDPKEQTLSLRLPMRPELERSPGSGRCHGGVISALIDTAGDFVLIMLTGAAPPTLNFRVDYLRPATSPALTAIARVRQLGRSIAFVDVDVVDDADRVVAIGRANYAMATNVPGKAA
jgi:uncharacterized protein (TIGR00369 family)